MIGRLMAGARHGPPRIRRVPGLREHGANLCG